MCTINDTIASICWNKQCDICPFRYKRESCFFMRSVVLQTKAFCNVTESKEK